VASLLISALFAAVGLKLCLGLVGFEVPFIVTLIFGALISATDPVAVLALFKEYGAPKRLSLIFEGESLFNDGTSLALSSASSVRLGLGGGDGRRGRPRVPDHGGQWLRLRRAHGLLAANVIGWCGRTSTSRSP
jgi:NhaP-type Na+/H+ or K+/H+ antiporter